MKILIYFLFTSFLFSASLMEEKINLEETIRSRVENIVEKIIGNKDMIVFVNVDISPKEKKGRTPTTPYPGAGLTDTEVLPGISYTFMPVETSAGEFAEVKINKIEIKITLDEIIEPAIIERIRKEVTDILGLNPLRGDIVDIRKTKFAKAPEKPFLQRFLTVVNPHLPWMLALALLGFFLYGPLRHFFRTIGKAMELRIEADVKSRGTERMEFAPTPGAPGVPGVPLGAPAGPLELTLTRGRPKLPEKTEPTKRFGFINEGNIKNLIFLLKKEPAETVAIVINYLPPELATKVFESFDTDSQAKIALHLANPKLMDAEDVDKIENVLKSKIDYLIGGEEYFMTLFETIEMGTQQALLKSLEGENPILAEKLKKLLFFFEDIPILEKTALQRVIREAQRAGVSLALALKNSPEDVKLKIMDSLTEGARAMLAEQIDLLGEVSEKRIQEEQKKIITIVKELEKIGEIIIDREKRGKVEPTTTIKPEEVT